MIKNVLKFEASVEGKSSQWLLENDTPLPVAKEMLFQFSRLLAQIEDQLKAQQESQKKVEEGKFEAEQPTSE